ncbi:specifically androgen-regulated gene protein [Phascolarctos cinereus]|nr:specifically androgen-regulated gene protein-like isoform X2 [Phascolarctos cinereus]XP_020858724.1 specifically androgen-regulated gene protein-like isoform X2 [Phascolarctos cinereus]XP_020858725.1 specifically androgen-regulated gene protein-like isoform X2 [Phascolarctos cinereus]
MPERELWPEGPGTEPVTHIGSCDSMTSINSTHSGFSDNSYDFLSAEEKECLLFLEETIGSLDKEADSGLSTDESEPATPQGPRTQPALQGSPEERLTQEGSEQKRDIQSSLTHLRQAQELGLKSGSHSLPRNIHISRDQSLREGSTCLSSQSEGHIPKGLVSTPLQNRGSSVAPPVSPGTPSELAEVLIPPPEAFRDTYQKQGTRGSLSLKEKTKPGQGNLPWPHSAPDTQKKEAFLKNMSQRTSEKNLEGVSRQPGLPPTLPSENRGSEDFPLPAGDDKGTKFPPPTAPKSRKLPPNIILKTSRSNFPSDPQNRFSHRSQATPREATLERAGSVASGLQEQRRARREALEKLGLPQDHNDEPNLHLAKSGSILRSKQSPAQAPTPDPAPILAPAPSQAPAPVRASVPAPAPAPVSASSGVQAPVSSQAVASVPASAKATGPPSTPIPIPKPTKVSSSPPTQSRSDSRLELKEGSIPGLRQMNFKSNTLERSGVGLSSYLLAEKHNPPQTSTSLGKVPFLDRISPNVLRNTRPRPASLGGGKDFANIQVGKLADLEQEKSSQRFSYPGQSRDKLPRPPCVSVKITPKGIPDENRREALKKLGLLKE